MKVLSCSVAHVEDEEGICAKTKDSLCMSGDAFTPDGFRALRLVEDVFLEWRRGRPSESPRFLNYFTIFVPGRGSSDLGRLKKALETPYDFSRANFTIDGDSMIIEAPHTVMPHDLQIIAQRTAVIRRVRYVDEQRTKRRRLRMFWQPGVEPQRALDSLLHDMR